MPQAGQLDWRSQATGTSDGVNNYVVQAILDKQLYTEVRDSGVFGPMSRDMEFEANGNGMYDAKVDATTTSAVWSAPSPNGDEKRFSLLRTITGAASYGDTAPKEGDYQAYLFQNVYLNEIDSPKIPIPGRMSQQRIKAMIADLKGPARQAVVDWQSEEKDWDYHAAVVEGESYPLLLDPATYPGALGKDLGLGVGVGAPCELFYTATTGSQVAIPAGGPRTAAYRTQYITDLQALAANGAKLMSSISPAVMWETANVNKIKKVRGGADHDYECIIDPTCLRDMINSDASGKLMLKWQNAQQGTGLAGQKSLDQRGAIVLDGIRFVPSRTLAKFRPFGNGTSNGLFSGILQYGDGLMDRRNKRFTGANYKIGLAYLLGEGSLLNLDNGSVQTVEIEDEDHKGWETYSWLMRGVKRGFWQRKDGEAMTATDGWLQQSMIGFAFNITTATALV